METTNELCGSTDIRTILSVWSEPCDGRPDWQEDEHLLTRFKARVAGFKTEIASYKYVGTLAESRFVKPATKFDQGPNTAGPRRISLRAAGELAVSILRDAEAARATYAEEQAAIGPQYEP